MSDLAEFLLARIAEDEATLPHPPDAKRSTSRAWWSSDFDVVFVEEDRFRAECEVKRRIVRNFGSQCSDYVDPNNPEDVAREQEFREYVGEELYQEYVANGQRTHWPAGYSPFCDGCAAAQSADRDHERVLRLLALPYADHPDYRDEWRP